jgi:hypothetical protein
VEAASLVWEGVEVCVGGSEEERRRDPVLEACHQDDFEKRLVSWVRIFEAILEDRLDAWLGGS